MMKMQNAKFPPQRGEALPTKLGGKIQKYLIFYFILFVLSFMLTYSALAHTDGGFWKPGDSIVPCGNIKDANGNVVNPCTKCELLHLVRHVIDFLTIAATPILATFFFVVAGVFLMMGGANPGMLSTGKRIFKDTFIGLVIVMMAWLITNTIIRTLADPSALGGNWYEFSCPFEN